MQKKKKPIRSVRLQRLLRLHAVVTVLSLSAYFLVAFFDPGFLSYDLRQKYHALADEFIAVTATVLGPPEQPTVTAVSICDEDAGTLSVTLDWTDDANTITYDIDRDSLPLITDLVPSGYIDTIVAVGTTYEYVVTARGPMGPGFATSNPVSVTTPSGCEITAVTPTVNIISFGGRGVDSYDGTPRVSDRRPVFSGTTNMQSATIQVVIGPVSNLIAQFTANSNGYWEWKPPVGLTTGIQTFTVTAIDPNDPLRQATASLKFGIMKKEETGGAGQGAALPTGGIAAQIPLPPGQPLPITFILEVKNHDKKVWQGEPVNLYFLIKDLFEKYNNVNLPIRFSIVDVKGNAIVSLTHQELLQRGREIERELETPAYVAAGKYALRAEVLLGEANVSQSDEFTVVEVPFIHLGGGMVFTYADIVRNLGWVVLMLLILLLLWSLLFIKEYWMSLHALRYITEKHLEKAGLFSKRKKAVR